MTSEYQEGVGEWRKKSNGVRAAVPQMWRAVGEQDKEAAAVRKMQKPDMGQSVGEVRIMATVRNLIIEKSFRGWSLTQETFYGSNKAVTNSGAKTLAWALLNGLQGVKDTTINEIVVNGRDMARAEALTILEKQWGRGNTDYWLTDIRIALA